MTKLTKYPGISKIGCDIINKIIEATYHINNTNFSDAMSGFIGNIINIQLYTIPLFVPCDKKLHITRPKMREEIRKWLKIRLTHFFKERSYTEYDEINDCDVEKFEITIENAVQILAKKQQGL